MDICFKCIHFSFDLDVGPIWGNYEAAAKVNDYLMLNQAFSHFFEWNGNWVSNDDSSVAGFKKKKQSCVTSY